MATPLKRVPDPSPEEIERRCRDIQRTWDVDTTWAREHHLNLEDRGDFDWRPPVVVEPDVYSSGGEMA